MSDADWIDLSDLSDDQLVALAASCCAEAVRRGAATEAAVRGELLSALERRRVAELGAALAADRLRQLEAARVAQDAADRVRRGREAEDARERAEQERRDAEAERRRQAERWERRAAIARRVGDLVGSGWTVTVWHRGPDRRVFLDHADARPGRYGGVEGRRAEYYHTGTDRHPPGHLVTAGLGRLAPERRAALAALCAEIAERWSPGRLDCDAALAAAPDAAEPAGASA